MRILLDTNIFIPLEDSSINMDETLAELNRIVSGKHQLLIHPATKSDLNRDKDEDRKKIFLARLNKYQKLESPPKFQDDHEEKSLFGQPKNENDEIDNLILLAVRNNCVHLLVTHDQGIHKKAKIIGEEERVFTVHQAITTLSKADLKESKLYPSIREDACHSLDLKNSFFNSLRDAYDSFDSWFNEKCARAGRKAWICDENNVIHALCIFNIENNPIITNENIGLSGKILKLCTFKVEKRGHKIGELLLKQAFEYAETNLIDYIYVTIEPSKHELLEELFLEFGFYLYGTDIKGRDRIFVKDFPKVFPVTEDPPLEYAIKFFPKIKITNNSIYLVPIKPQYHEILFPELIEFKQLDLFATPPSSAGNTIKKLILCKSNVRSIKPGDIIFFYRTKDFMAITSYGIVDQFKIESDPEKISQWVSKRTVYTNDEIKKMQGKEIKIILFRFVKHLDENIKYNELLNLKAINGAIQSITRIDNLKAKLIIDIAKLNDSILSN